MDWRRDLTSPASVWREKELLQGKVVDVGVAILQTSGCRHYHEGGCSMCGYNVDGAGDVKPEQLEKQVEHALGQFKDVPFIKIYTSGSFLDECEVPSGPRDKLLSACADRGTRLLFETRPEFVTDQTLDHVRAIHSDIEIALGLESANDNVLSWSINKGFAVKDYDEAARKLKDKGIDVRTYVLLKPPFLTEREAVEDAERTIAHASKASSCISLNPVNVQKGTLVERLWRTWAYRPPWLWSVLEVLRSTKGIDSKIVCDPSGGGKERGAHNCGKCDGVVLDSVKAFSLSQDHSRLGAPDCECRGIWESVMELEGFVMGGTPDLQRFFRRQRA